MKVNIIKFKKAPKKELEYMRLRLETKIGNALTPIHFNISKLSDPKFSAKVTHAKIRKDWESIFHRLELFSKSDFEPTLKITPKNIKNILKYKVKDPLAPGVYEDVYELLNSIL